MLTICKFCIMQLLRLNYANNSILHACNWSYIMDPGLNSSIIFKRPLNPILRLWNWFALEYQFAAKLSFPGICCTTMCISLVFFRFSCSPHFFARKGWHIVWRMQRHLQFMWTLWVLSEPDKLLKSLLTRNIIYTYYCAALHCFGNIRKQFYVRQSWN